MREQVKSEVEKEIKSIMQTGISENNIDLLYSLIDIHKDIENEEYWDCKKEVLGMRYRDYDRRGYDNYGNKEYTLKSLDYMLKSVVQFMEILKNEATSEEEIQLIKEYVRRINEI